MNPPIDSPVNSIVQLFQAIVEVLPNGQFTTWVTEFQDSKVIAADSSACAKGDRATAIIELEKVLKKRLESIECVMIEVDSFAYAKGDSFAYTKGDSFAYTKGDRETQSIDTLPSIPMND
jgi:hypothetical protein